MHVFLSFPEACSPSCFTSLNSFCRKYIGGGGREGEKEKSAFAITCIKKKKKNLPAQNFWFRLANISHHHHYTTARKVTFDCHVKARKEIH